MVESDASVRICDKNCYVRPTLGGSDNYGDNFDGECRENFDGNAVTIVL